MAPHISVLLPVLNGERTIARSIHSILAQNYPDFELLVINEHGSDDDTAEIVGRLAENDSRIVFIQNDHKLGLAGSLNKGIKVASGELIARMDADDVSFANRFELQVDYMCRHPEVGVCGGWQKHIGPRSRWLHCPPSEPEVLAPSLLFSCEMCHSTVMMRKSVLVENGLLYQEECMAEDFELWTRMLGRTVLANIPVVLGNYYYGKSITQGKKAALEKEHGSICAAVLKRMLDVDIPEPAQELFNTWSNPFKREKNTNRRAEMLRQYAAILQRIGEQNNQLCRFDRENLLGVLRQRWRWAKWGMNAGFEPVMDLRQVFATPTVPHLQALGQRIRRRISFDALLYEIGHGERRQL